MEQLADAVRAHASYLGAVDNDRATIREERRRRRLAEIETVRTWLDARNITRANRRSILARLALSWADEGTLWLRWYAAKRKRERLMVALRKAP